QRRRHMDAALIIKKRAGKTLPPVRQHGHQIAAVERRPQRFLEAVNQPKSSNGSSEFYLQSRGNKRAIRLYANSLAISFKLPRGHDTAAEAMPDAGMVEHIARMRRRSMRREIGGRGRRDEALNTRANRHRDHVALNAFIIANAGIEA